MKSWKRYNYFDLLIGEKNELGDLQRNINPGKIDNEDILEVLQKDKYLFELAIPYKWQNTVMKPNLKEGEDFILLNEAAYDFLKTHY